MPNWCENKLTVIGSKALTFAIAVRGPGPKYAPQGFEKEEQVAKRNKTILELSFNTLVPIPKEALKDYTNLGYEAERKLWGVKWGASDILVTKKQEGLVAYQFQTPWGPPEVWLQKVSKKFKTLKFALSYAEESPSRGRFVIQDGELIRSWEGDKCNVQLKVSEEATAKAFRDWQYFYYNAHDTWVSNRYFRKGLKVAKI